MKAWIHIWDMARKQGVSFLLLLGIVYYFQSQNNVLQAKVDECNRNQLQFYKEQVSELKEVVQENTEVVRNFSFFLKENGNN